ncbi:DUF4158 domain-containing protein [Nonomuraea sp. NPDC050786]|uniref:DUF4158 domain-containing protein n=1 Tax=Nonomuraea sp. NPDC050786 TaxID=3154840 RepID=UPI0033CE358D
MERTAYRVLPRLMMTRELYMFFSPSQEEMAWAREKTDTDEHLLALTLALKCFQRLGRFAKAREVPVVVVEHVRPPELTDRGIAALVDPAGWRQWTCPTRRESPAGIVRNGSARPWCPAWRRSC